MGIAAPSFKFIRRGQRFCLLVALGLSLVIASPVWSQGHPCRLAKDFGEQSPAQLSLPETSPNQEILKDSWVAYRQRFIQADGRVIDWEAQDRTVSEGQAYAMLRAVLINDPGTFNRTYRWAQANLSRRDPSGQPRDRLWSWLWGQQADGGWGVIDPNFATDADIDAATALILAGRRWGCETYLEEARALLADIWSQSVVMLPNGEPQLLPGPRAAFWPQPDTLILNPSYFSPYAYRLFAQVDPNHDWQGLIDSGYAMLTASTALSAVGLPSDWVAYDPATGNYRPLKQEFGLTSRYSFDAFRVWWRLALDASWFHEPRASAYLDRYLAELGDRWRRDRRLAASIGLDGSDLVDYASTAQYAMLYAAWRQIESPLAIQMQQQLMATYQDGLWDNDTAYYTQNLAWFGLLANAPPVPWLQALTQDQPDPRPLRHRWRDRW